MAEITDMNDDGADDVLSTSPESTREATLKNRKTDKASS